jgi:hypothetical protein
MILGATFLLVAVLSHLLSLGLGWNAALSTVETISIVGGVATVAYFLVFEWRNR